jgi:DNA-binding MarR family transcriptional regulator
MKASAGVTGPQRLVLRVLQLAPETPPTELARILFFHKSTVTIIVRGLEKAKLVSRSPNPNDGRAVVLTLTPKGRRIAEQRTGTVEAVFRKVLERIPASNVQAAQTVIEELAHALT